MTRKLTLLLLSCSMLTASLTFADTTADQVNTLLEQAQTLLGSDIDDAEEKIEEALELAPQRADVHFLCGQVMGIQAGSYTHLTLPTKRKCYNKWDTGQRT